jgi:hypothetical protein
MDLYVTLDTERCGVLGHQRDVRAAPIGLELLAAHVGAAGQAERDSVSVAMKKSPVMAS